MVFLRRGLRCGFVFLSGSAGCGVLRFLRGGCGLGGLAGGKLLLGSADCGDHIGHGLGQELHEDPEVPNYDTGRKGPVMRPGLVIAVEPMLTLGTHKVVVAPDGWVASTKDGSLSAHYENTIVINENGPCSILTIA